MKFKYIYLFLLFGEYCFGYKLRKDIGKIRYYCRELCESCGGVGVMNLDKCICNFDQAVAEDIQLCLKKARNKFNFLGIKCETGHGPIHKRSTFDSVHPSFMVRQKEIEDNLPFDKKMVLQRKRKNSLDKRYSYQ